jgi:regulator of sigma E protease
VAGQAAAKAGLLSGDKLVVIAGQPVAVWQDAVELIRTSPNQALNIEIERDGARQPIQLTPAAHSLASGEIVGRIGVSVALPEMPANMQVLVRSGIVEGLWVASKETVSMIAFTLNSIKKMLAGLISTDNLSGPVTIAKIASASAASGLTPYLQFLALISISLGVINLLPIPVLDGGQLVMLGAEAVTGKPLPERVMQFVQQVGLMLILSIMALALYNDFTRL